MSKTMLEALEARQLLSAALPTAASTILTTTPTPPPVVTPITPVNGTGVTINEIAGEKFTATLGSFKFTAVNMKFTAR